MSAVVHYVMEMLPWMLIFLPVYLVVRALILVRRRRAGHNVVWLREALLLCFALFCVGLASQTILPELYIDQSDRLHAVTVFSEGWERRMHGVNLRPLRTIAQYFSRGNRELFIINIAGNVGIFAPLGFFIPLLWPRWRKWYKTVLWGFGISCLIEAAQIFTFRSVDVDDVLLNTLGAALGYAFFALLRKCLRWAADKTEPQTKEGP